ncbi:MULTISPECIES: hypothetical protein [Sphingomonadaceae]|nr:MULTISPECIES: hypothetical protein [Sphingomonadaceae]MBZ9645920.1 hypothetical protein [Sphingobium sp. 3R8]
MKAFILTAGLVMIAVTACLWQSDWLAQDQCLDSGGRWSQTVAACQR